MKQDLKAWNEAEFGNIDGKILQLGSNINDPDQIASSRLLDEEEIMAQKPTQHDLKLWLKRKELIWAKKSRVKWLKEEHRSTNFFRRWLQFENEIVFSLPWLLMVQSLMIRRL